MTRRRSARALGATVAAVAVLLSGCAPLPATGPRLATGDGPGAEPRPDGSGDPTTPPDWVAPRADLDWAPCADGGSHEIPADAHVDCAVPGDIPILRLTTSRTPADAPPLVLVAGPEPAPDDLILRLATVGSEITDAHPVVLLDHRGRRGPAGSCLTFEARRTLDGLAQQDVDPTGTETRADLADASQSCTDQLMGRELDYGSTSAAQDLESLRRTWGVPGLAVLGVGSGARTALAYAGSRPGRVSLLVLDSPAPAGGDQEAAARAALGGSDAALRLWAASCTRDECGSGDVEERVEAIARALDDAGSPGSAVPAALLSDVVRSALADLSGASADSASPGDVLLGDLVDATPDRLPGSVRARAEELSSSSLPYVAGCSDLSDRVPVSRVGELSAEWEGDPPFGEILAAQLPACSTWPVPAPSPVQLPGPAPVLLLSGIADPVAGAAPLEPTAGMLTAAGARDVRTVTWGAPGSRVLLHSSCARSAVAGFLTEPDSAEPSAACPS